MTESRRRIIARFQLVKPDSEEIYLLDRDNMVSLDRVFDLKVVDYRAKNNLNPVIRPPKDNV